MSYEDIRTGSQLYHVNPGAWDHTYDSYLRDKRQALWDSGAIDLKEAARLIRFANQWSSRSPLTPEQLMPAINAVLPSLNLLADQDLLQVDLGSSVRGKATVGVIREAFDTIARCGDRYESTATSKMLHMINPNLFVMWDAGIKAYLKVNGRDGAAYANIFLPGAQRLARDAVRDCTAAKGLSDAEAVRYLCPCGQTLAKVIDERNWQHAHEVAQAR